MGPRSPAEFLGVRQRLLDRARKVLGEYLGDPDPDNVRALRTALRKFEASAKVLPKGKWKKEKDEADEPNGRRAQRRMNTRCAKLLRLTSPIRDVDILVEKLSPHVGDPYIARSVKHLRDQRDAAVDRSMKASWRLFEQHEGETVEEQVFVGIDRMIGKAMNELDAKISTEVAKVVADEREAKVLHSLRKHCKRLRYTLELLPATERRTDAVALLLRWQDSLGAIRDSDILIGHIEGSRHRSAAMEDLLAAEAELRHRRYGAFAKSYTRGFGDAPFSLWRLRR